MKERGQEQQEREKDIVEIGFENLLTELQQGKSEHLRTYLAFMSRFHKYSPTNQMLIFMQKPDATLVAGYGTWMKEGNPVRKGQKGIMIYAPLRKKDKATDEERIFGFRAAHVFDVSQTVSPDSVPSFWKRLPDTAQEQYDRVKAAVIGEGIAVSENEILQGGTLGESRGGVVAIAQGLDSQSATMVLIHEWAHERIHRREMTPEERAKTPKEVRECQAEAVSFIVSGALGLENPFSSDYLLAWGNTAEDLTRNMDVVQKTSKAMLALLTVKDEEE